VKQKRLLGERTYRDPSSKLFDGPLPPHRLRAPR
jgi:hypothetical protein